VRANAAAPRRSTLTILTLLLAGAAPASAQRVPVTPAESGSTLAPDPRVRSAIEMLEAWIRTRMESVGPPGLSVAVTFRGDVVWSEGFGFADVEHHVPASAATVYRAASLTKALTAISILQLRDAGKLRLDDPVTAHLPWFAAAERAHTDPAASPVRIRDLLTHSAGIGGDGPGQYWSDFSFPDDDAVHREMLARVPPFEPGVTFKYSNWGYALLGEIVESASGEPYPEYVRRHVLDALGMRHSTVKPFPDMPGLAVGYGRALAGGAREVMPFSDVRALVPAAGLATTVGDLARLTGLLAGRSTPGIDSISGPPLLSRGSLREMTRFEFPRPVTGQGYGFGLMVFEQPRRLIGHVAILNGYSGTFFIDPASGIGVVALANSADAQLFPGEHLSIADRMLEWLTPPIVAAAFDTAGPQPSTDRFRAVTGTYRALAADLQVGMYMDELVAFDPLHPPPASALTRLIPDGAGRYRVEASGDEVLSNGATVEFSQPGSDGRMTRLVVPGAYFDRVR